MDNTFPNMLKLYEGDVSAYPGSHLDLPIKVAMSICGKFPSCWDYLMDFIQEGNLELLRCVEVFHQEHPEGDIEHFRNYAASCIRGVIYLYFSRIHPIYIPPGSRQHVFVNQGRNEALAILEQHYSLSELYEHVAQIAEPTNMLQAYCDAKARQVEELLTRLSPVEKRVITLRYGLEGVAYTPKEIACELRIAESHVYVLTLRALARMNGSTGLPRVLKERQRAQARTDRLQPLYDARHGIVTEQQLMDLTGCTRHDAETFLRERRGKTKEMNPARRKEKMEALYAEWQAQGKKITVHAFCKAGHWDTQETGTFLREKRRGQ